MKIKKILKKKISEVNFFGEAYYFKQLFFYSFLFWWCGGLDKTKYLIRSLYKRGFTIYRIIFSLISQFIGVRFILLSIWLLQWSV